MNFDISWIDMNSHEKVFNREEDSQCTSHVKKYQPKKINFASIDKR